MVDQVDEAVGVVGPRHPVGCGLHAWISVAHGYAEACGVDHREVVEVVSHRADLTAGDVQLCGEMQNS